jgi:hypothetical protein
MRLFLRLENEQKSCAIWVHSFLEIALFVNLKGVRKAIMSAIILETTITCPECNHAKLEVMPTDACQWVYECEACHVLLRPKAGDCCVFCSYATVPCPPKQISGKNCCG